MARWPSRCPLPSLRTQPRSSRPNGGRNGWRSISRSGPCTAKEGQGMRSRRGVASARRRYFATGGPPRFPNASRAVTAAAVCAIPTKPLSLNAGTRVAVTPGGSSGRSKGVGMPGAIPPGRALRRVCARRRARCLSTDRVCRGGRSWRTLYTVPSRHAERPGWSCGAQTCKMTTSGPSGSS
jgi:hypothetical protein